MRLFKQLLLGLLGLYCLAATSQSITVHTIGDSTMANYDSTSTDKRGWGMLLEQFFTNKVSVNNRGKSGASSKSFYKESSYWQSVKTQIKAGDYVLIQFAHNDEKNNGYDGDTLLLSDPTLTELRGTTASGTFKDFLRKYIDETKALGATPVLVTAICRKYFGNGTITRTGRHDLGEKFNVGEDDHTYDYSYQMKQVALEYDDVKVIDLTTLTKELYLSLGIDYCTQNLFFTDDNTHLVSEGATRVARMCVEEMQKQGILAEYIYLTDEGEEEEPKEETTDSTAVDVSATWAFNLGTSNSTTALYSNDTVFSLSSFSIGGDFAVTGTRTVDGIAETTLKPATQTSAASSTNRIQFSLLPKKGIKFKPTKVSFYATRIGTDGGKIDMTYQVGDKSAVSLSSGNTPNRNNATPPYSFYSLDVSNATFSGDQFNLNIHIYNLGTNKEVGIANVVVEGEFSGSVEKVTQYDLTTALSNPEAGTITVNPNGTTFDENTELSVSASENFGFHFQKWVDESGETVSTNNPYYFTITAPTQLTAVYEQVNTYALNIAVEGGANSYMVTASPQGTIVNGVSCYEEGTEVSVTATNNPILLFTHWEDNSTVANRLITMNEDMDLTAHYSATEYIVGWDMYLDEPKSERAADFKSNAENAGLLSLHKADGTTSSWLAKGVNTGLYNDKYCAVNWNPFGESDNYYYEISFATTDYVNVALSATMGLNFNGYSVQKVQYSVDGTNYNDAGSITINEPKIWSSETFTLPESCWDVPKVNVRFIPDYTSTIVGTESGNDGTCITDIYVTGEENISKDTLPPMLVSSLPANDATGVSASGSIILTFSEKMISGSGDCTLSGEALTATFSGKTVLFPYSGLDYNSNYTFVVPSGAFTDRNGNLFEGCEIHFTTMERTQPAPRLYDAVVAADGSGDYTKVQDAIDAVPNNRASSWLIFVKNGVYDELIQIPSNKPHIHLIGQDKEKTKIQFKINCAGSESDAGFEYSYTKFGVSIGSSVIISAADFYSENISYINTWGYEMKSGPQALTLRTDGDRTVFNNCNVYSYQDTWRTSTKGINDRLYVKNCFIEGAVDFIYGAGECFFDCCTLNIVRKSGGYIVAPNHKPGTRWGYVFMNNIITAPDIPSETSVWLGRPWNDNPITVFINTTAQVTIPAAGWYQTMGGIPTLWADYNTMDGNGNVVDLSYRNNYYYYYDDDNNKVEGYAKNYLTDDEAAQYTVKNVLSGDDSWQPELMTEPCATPLLIINGHKLVWEAVPYAICYVVTKDDVVVGFTTDCSFQCNGDGNYTVQAVNEFGGLSEGGSVTVTAIATPTNVSEVTGRTIYSLSGTAKAATTKGFNIVRETNNDGSTRTKKVFQK